ncbi:hypothetical protein [Promicromonospora iranensis]|uniref:PH-like domain-containing protein n=1 Tax=Promicromonospora iranensis TaxID=1105144 RepID=UPI0023A9DB56|nr:hypothetical protein [Promicromonospora iranensis]
MRTLAVVLLVLLAIALVRYVALIGPRRLARRTSSIVPPPPPVPGSGPDAGSRVDSPGQCRFGPVEAVYVSSTLHGDWLARVGAHGLGDRSSARISVHDDGVLITRDGTRDLWLPATALHDAALAPGMAGKYVGGDGLVVLTWTVPAAAGIPATTVDTGLRTRHAADRGNLLAAVRELQALPQSPRPS